MFICYNLATKVVTRNVIPAMGWVYGNPDVTVRFTGGENGILVVSKQIAPQLRSPNYSLFVLEFYW